MAPTLGKLLVQECTDRKIWNWMIRHYYHLYADGRWRIPVDEHIAALLTIDEPIVVTVGLVGAPESRAAAREALRELPVLRWVEVDSGFEQVTLDVLREDLADGHDDSILYAHTKSASAPTQINLAWRSSMSRRVVRGWRHCLSHLDEVDAVGCHWLTPQQFPTLVTSPFFGGNFWWATARYLRTLPPVSRESRWHAESWVGLGDPVVHDLLPGWPAMHLFRQEVA